MDMGRHMNRRRAACVGWFVCSLVAAPIALVALPSHARLEQAPPIADAPTSIRVALGADHPPFVTLDARGQPQGYTVDRWRLFEAHTGVHVRLEALPSAEGPQAVLAGRADVVDMRVRTPAREAAFDFSQPYLTLPVAIFVPRRAREVNDVADLRGRAVGVARGDTCAATLGGLGVADLRMYPSYADVVRAATKRKVAAFCMGADTANYLLAREGAAGRFRQAFVLYQDEARDAVREGNQALLAAVAAGMARITPSEWQTLGDRWLKPAAVEPAYVKAVKLALALVLAIAAVLTLWVWLLRRSVAERTRDLEAEQGKLRALFDASPDAMWVTDPERRMLECNDRAAQLFELPRDAMLMRTASEALAGFNQAFTERSKTLNAAIIATGARQQAVLPLQLRDGSVLRVDVIKVPLVMPDGGIRGILSVARDITEHLRVQAELELWAHLFMHAAFGLAIFDSRTRRITAANPTFARERGYTPEEMAGMHVDRLYPEDLIEQRRKARERINAVDHSLIETEQVTRDGRRFPVLLDCSVPHDAQGQAHYVIVYAQDISQRRRAEAELRLAEVAFETQEALMVMDAARTIQRVNRAFTELTGFAPAEAVGRRPAWLRSRHHEEAFGAEAWGQVASHGYWQGEQWIRVKASQPRVVRATLSAVKGADGAITHFVGAMVDMTSEREAHANLDRMTFFDPLTELPNRDFLLGQLQHMLDEGGGGGGALLLIDLDHFKRVNDLRGHAAGDRLLLLIAQRLRPLLEAGNQLSRFSGGTFALLLRCDGADAEARVRCAAACAERIGGALREPFHLGDSTPVAVTASVGWTEVVAGHGSAESVLKEAELAMYSAKASGRDQVRRFAPVMQVELARHENLVRDLRRAIAGEAFDLYLQAQVNRQGRVTGAEALLRWSRPGGEPVSPGLFVPIAEENGLIVPIGDWVLRRSCEQLVAWSTRPATRRLSLAVNVSAHQFVRPEFVAGVRQALATTGADPARLKLEITESAVLGDLTDAATKLSRLRALGIQISLDDFGTGYSSLSYLSRLPLDQLKIDQSFVARLPDGANDAMLVQTIIGMGRGLGMEVIAEGVETQAQWDFLMAHGCDAFQGYLISKPIPRAAFEALLDRMPAPTGGR
jgi:diguanylate cyclase (GGDEF)-like protein/PAS domain S-box-containing protein